jgi:hypothetical protein
MKRLTIALLTLLLAGLIVGAQDVITPIEEPNPNAAVKITFPPPVYVLSGPVQIRGSAASGNLANYFLEFRPLEPGRTASESDERLNPWFPATLPSSNIVQDGVLGVWNTATAPDGLYELRLTVNITGASAQRFRVSPLRVENNPPDFVIPSNPSRPGLIATPTQLPGGPIARPTQQAAAPGGFDPNPRVTAQVDSNVRRGDSTAYERVGALLEGETAPIIGVSSAGSGWYYIELDNGRRGFIASSIVRADGDLSRLRRINPPPLPTPTFTPTPAAVADLLIDGFSISPAQPVCNEQFTVSMNVTNAGNGPSGQSATLRLVDIHVATGTQTLIGTGTVPSLQPGENWVVQLSGIVGIYFSENHRLTATVDAGGAVIETNEGNNTFSRTYVLDAGGC